MFICLFGFGTHSTITKFSLSVIGIHLGFLSYMSLAKNLGGREGFSEKFSVGEGSLF